MRRTAFEAAGGFAGHVVSGGDADLCWRLRADGWELEERPRAAAGHRSRERAGALLAQVARHGEGAGWLERRWPGSAPAPTARSVLGGVAAALRADPGPAGLLDAAALLARDAGRLRGNVARRGGPPMIAAP